MVRRALVILILFLIPACKKSVRVIDICQVDEKVSKFKCAHPGKQWELKHPEETAGFFAWDFEAMMTLADSLEECERNQKLEKPGDTLAAMRVCEVGKTCQSIDGFFATDSKGLSVIKKKLKACGEK